MIIIAESGATKTDWRSVSADGTVHSLKTRGMNVAAEETSSIEKTLEEAIPELNPGGEKVTEIHFYAAGLISAGEAVPESARNLDKVLRAAYPDAEIEYASDLLDAARALCGHEPGVAVILGTGSNSCEYDGSMIVKNVRSGGFILGDEGGAACLGKMFMSDFLKGLVPKDIAEEFASEFKVDYFTVVRNVYKGEAPSRYLGGFAPFIVSRYERNGYMQNLVEENFRSLFRRCLSQYDLRNRKVGIVGGFGQACSGILKKVASEYGIEISGIMPSPIDALVKFHTS